MALFGADNRAHHDRAAKKETDYLPQCGGVWLDRGGLGLIIERIEQASMPSMA